MHCTVLCVALLMLSLRVQSSPQKFCGDNLTRIMSEYCLSYNTPGHRVRRQIVKECCRNTCDLQYLLSYYCQSYNSDALKRYLERENEITKEKAVQNENIEQENVFESYSHRNDLPSQVSENHSHGLAQTFHVDKIHNSQRQLSSHHFHSSHDRKRRKVKSCHNKNKNSKGRVSLEKSDFIKNTVPEAKVGQIEDSQQPFYVFKRYKR